MAGGRGDALRGGARKGGPYVGSRWGKRGRAAGGPRAAHKRRQIWRAFIMTSRNGLKHRLVILKAAVTCSLAFSLPLRTVSRSEVLLNG